MREKIRHCLLQKIQNYTHGGRYLTCITNNCEKRSVKICWHLQPFGHRDLLEHPGLWKVVLTFCVLRWPQEFCQLMLTNCSSLKQAPAQIQLSTNSLCPSFPLATESIETVRAIIHPWMKEVQVKFILKAIQGSTKCEFGFFVWLVSLFVCFYFFSLPSQSSYLRRVMEQLFHLSLDGPHYNYFWLIPTVWKQPLLLKLPLNVILEDGRCCVFCSIISVSQAAVIVALR